ncbi:hypothetical protein D3C76_1552840 [compost metagenome]
MAFMASALRVDQSSKGNGSVSRESANTSTSSSIWLLPALMPARLCNQSVTTPMPPTEALWRARDNTPMPRKVPPTRAANSGWM